MGQTETKTKPARQQPEALAVWERLQPLLLKEIKKGRLL